MKYLSLAALLIASAAFVACSGSDNDSIIDEPQPVNPTGQYTMTIKASKGDDAALTRALSLSGSTLNATWADGEEVLVYQGNTQIGTLTATASTTNEATLTGTLDSAPDASQALTFYFHTEKVPTPSAKTFITEEHYNYYEGQDGTLETIASTYDFCNPATVASGNFTVDTESLTITVPDGISFGDNLQAIVKFTLVDKANPDTKLNASSLTVTASRQSITSISACDFNYTFTIPASTYETNGDGVVYLAIPAYFRLTASTTDPKCFALTATVGDETYIFGRADFPFQNKKYYDITVKMAPPILATAADLCKVIGSDCQIYANADAATNAGTSAIAMIAYVGTETGELAPYKHGLAIALSDCPATDANGTGYQYKSTIGTANHSYTYPPAKTPNATPADTPFALESGLQYNTLHKKYIDGNGYQYPAFRAAIYQYYIDNRPSCYSEWFLGTGYQWQQMIASMGSFSALRTAFNSVGGTNMDESIYWTSTQKNTSKAWYVSFSGDGGWGLGEFVDDYFKVRPVLAF